MSREEAIEIINRENDPNDKKVWELFPEYREALDMAIQALSQEPCEDAVSREELLKAIETWDKFGCDADTKLVPYKDHYIPYIHYDDVIKAIKGMPSVTPSIPTEHKPICDDCIYFDNGKGSEKCDSCELTGTNKPSRHKGHWISHILSIECSECKQKFFADDENENCQDYDACEDFGFKYCPNCGAEMKGGAE